MSIGAKREPSDSTQLPFVFILSIGSELTSGKTVNTNGAAIAKELSERGFAVRRIIVLTDTEEEIIEEARRIRAIRGDKILISSGGLGATADDKTVIAFAKAYGVGVLEDAQHKERLLQAAKGISLRGKILPDRFFSQALFPAGFQIEANPWGTAPFLYRVKSGDGGCESLFLLPGIPYECLCLFREKVLPFLESKYFKERAGGVGAGRVDRVYFEDLKIINVSEIFIQAAFDGLAAPRELEFSLFPDDGEVRAHFSSRNKQLVQEYCCKLERKLREDPLMRGKCIYHSALLLSEYLHKRFLRLKIKVGFVESITGGLLSATFTRYGGASNYLHSSVVSYSNISKVNLLGVRQETIEEKGAISLECAREMAWGYACRHGLDLTLSVTGVAGPGSGERGDRVGLAYLGLYITPHLRSESFDCEVLMQTVDVCQKRVSSLDSIGARMEVQKRVVKKALIFLAETQLSIEAAT